MNHRKTIDVAIVGMACQMPGAKDYETYWQNLVAKKNAIREIPADRWDVAEHYSSNRGEAHKSISKWCGLIEDIKKFDNDFFHISPIEARHMDPQQRLLLQESWRCIEDSGIPLTTLQQAKTSVFVGAMTADYFHGLQKSQDGHNRFAILGNDHCILANRVSHQLNLTGESISINAASASSLVAIHKAKSALVLGECDYAIAAGVNLNTDPYKYIVFSQAGMLSPDGQCKSFAADANGYVPGDGVGVLLLMPLAQAIQQKQHIYGVIKGSAINHIGASKSITAPCADAQTAVIKDALNNARRQASDVSYVEAHGSGTPLGDPVEIEALSRIYKHVKSTVIVGTVKPNIGHLEAAAGIAAVIKALMVLKHQYVPANLNLNQINPVLKLNNSHLKLASGDLLDLFEKPCVGVSSFGLGGVSCHLILEKYQANNQTATATPSAPSAAHFLLSAKSPTALSGAIKGWREYLQSQNCQANQIQDLCATMATGRQQFAHRIGFLTANKDELFSQLNHAKSIEISHRKSCSLVFADQHGLKLKEQVALVKDHYQKLWQQVEAAAQYDKRKATSIFRTADFQNTLCSVAVFNALQDMCVQPDLIEQTGQNPWAALMCSEMIQLDDYLAVVLHNKKLEEVTFCHPKYPVKFSPHSDVIYPQYINHHFMGQFFKEVASQPSSHINITKQAIVLLANDERFAELLSTWQYASTTSNDLLTTIRQFPQVLKDDVQLAAYALVAANVSLKRFYQRWHISDEDHPGSYHMTILSELITQKILSPSVFYKISQKPAIAAANFWTEMNRRHWRIINPLLCDQRKQRHKKVINKPQSLITELQSSNNQLSKHNHNLHRVAIGPVSPSNKSMVDTELNDFKTWQNFLLTHWLQGHDLDWQKLYPINRFNKLSLPAYVFDQNSFWTQPPVPDNPSSVESASTPPTKTVSQEPVVVDTDLSGIHQTIIQAMARQLSVDPEIIDPAQALNSWGLDSMAYTALCDEINASYGSRLTPACCYGFSDLNQLIDAVKKRVTDSDNKPPLPTQNSTEGDAACPPSFMESIENQSMASATTSQQSSDIQDSLSATKTDDVAIVGYAGTMPNASSLEEFWLNMINGVDGITEIPDSRWRWQDWYDQDLKATNKTPSKWGGFITDMGCFDAAFFGVSPQEAKLMDPQQRILLQTAWHALEHAGQQPASLAGTNTGVFVGASTSDYEEIIRDHDLAAHASTGMNRSIIANRLSYVLDIHGPSEVIDTACSSSLVAVHQAVQAIKSGTCRMALAGGVNALLTPTHYISYGKAGMLSPDGRCKTFDANANGYVRSEGVGVVVLKPLSQAIKDRDCIHAVIKASGSNHGGRANALTAPNPNAQAQLIIDTYRQAGIESHSIDYIENHGTGTPLGDPIEINGLNLAFEQLAADETPDETASACLLASVKSHIGHLEAAAGVAGLLKLMLALKHQQLPAGMHLKRLNPYLQLESKRFAILQENQPWPSQPGKRLRRAGISSFGFGGVNAHLVIEEHGPALNASPADSLKPAHSNKQLVLLSAKTKSSLQSQAEQWLHYCRDNRASLRLADVAYTSQVGRNHEPIRLAVCAVSMEELIKALQAHLSKQAANGLIAAVDAELPKVSKMDLAQWWMEQQLEKMAQWWVAGMDVNWQQLAPLMPDTRKVPLPTYPFAKTQHWLTPHKHRQSLDTQLKDSIAGSKYTPAGNNDLLPSSSENSPATQTPRAKGLKFQLKADHHLATEHVVDGQAIAPGVLSLALMCQSLVLADNQPEAICIKDLCWHIPIGVGEVDVTLQLISESHSGDLHLKLINPSSPQPVIHSSAICRFSHAAMAGAPPNNLSTFRPLQLTAVYQQLNAVGFVYGSNFQVIKQLIKNQGHYVAKLRITDAEPMADHHPTPLLLDTRLLDGALQVCLVALLDSHCLPTGQGHSFVPMMAAECRVLKAIPDTAFVHVYSDTKNKADAETCAFDVFIVDHKNRLCVTFKQLLFKKFKLSNQVDVIKPEVSQPVSTDVPTKPTEPTVQARRKTTVNMQTLRHNTTEFFIKHIAEAAGLTPDDIDLKQPFKSYGIDSFLTLTIIRNLEMVFGELRKTLLFEASNVNELVELFIEEHQETLLNLFDSTASKTVVEPLATASAASESPEPPPKPASPLPASDTEDDADLTVVFARSEVPQVCVEAIPTTSGYQVFSELLLMTDAGLKDKVDQLLAAFGGESIALSRKDIAPWVFLTSNQSAMFYFNTHQDVLLAFRYVGSEGDFPTAILELQTHSQAEQLHLNVLAECRWPAAQQQGFTANAFGVVQRINSLPEFGLDGAKMRRLRYQVNKFQQTGLAETIEYRVGEDVTKDQAVTRMIEQWASSKSGVNPYIWRVKDEMETGCLGRAHRVFLTYLDRSLQNVVIVSRIESDNSYLLDTEFYASDMAMGAMDFAIHEIIKRLQDEGCAAFSLGLTFGASFFEAEQADPEVSQAFDQLAADDVFAETGNFQFKNKFRCDNSPLYLYRSSQQPAKNVLDLIMMIGNPSQVKSRSVSEQMSVQSAPVPAAHNEPAFGHSSDQFEKPATDHVNSSKDRSAALEQAGHNPFNLSPEAMTFDLATDSWSELEYRFIHTRTQQLQARIKPGAPTLESVISDLFGLPHVMPFSAGRVAESFFCPAWPKGKKYVIQNVLFPTCLYHQINNDFMPLEIIDSEFLNRQSTHIFKGNMDTALLQQKLKEHRNDVAFVWVELANNAAGGCSVSLQNLRDIKACIGDIPLVIDATRIIENACHIAAHETGQQGRDIWAIVKDLCACADAINASLTKDFGSHIGGFIATQDATLFADLQDAIATNGSGLSRNDRQLLTQALMDREWVEDAVKKRMGLVQHLASKLLQNGIELVQPIGGHCVLLDPLSLPGMSELSMPLPAFIAWLYQHTGIRVNVHSVGRQRNTTMNQLIRLAIPVGLDAQQVDTMATRLVALLTRDSVINDLALVSKPPGLFGDLKARYAIKQSHSLSLSKDQHQPSQPTTVMSHQTTTTPTTHTTNRAKRADHLLPATDIAVIGMSGRYPDAQNLKEFWQNLCQGRNSIKPGPDWSARRMDPELPQHMGGFIDDVDKFDSLFFSLSPREAQNMDPQERLMMEVAWEALEDAGYHPEALAEQLGSNQVGVYVGAVWSYYEMLGAENRQQGGGSIANSQHWGISNRVSSFMNFSGPSLTVDTACSSSLTAIHLACEGLRQGECQVALAGGVNLDLHPSKYHITQAAQFLSDDGLCRAFGQGGSGYVAGEGVGTLVLKPLAQAEQDGDHIYGVIKGTAINHGGRTAGYTVPSPKAQAALISRALKKAGVSADTISYVEAHGTGTELGDPIEIQGASQAYRQDTAAKQYCAIGSVKTNIGHLEAAAGIAGATKLLLQMQHKQLVPSLHSTQLNEHIDFANSPFYVQKEKSHWQALEVAGQMLPRRAGLSSFGAGGTNVHVIFEEYPNSAEITPTSNNPELVILSARKPDQLQQQAKQLLHWLNSTTQQAFDLRALAHTLQVGRLPLNQRLAVIAKDKDSLINGLSDFINQKSNKTVFQADGATKMALNLFDGSESEQILAVLVEHGSFDKLAQLWVNGVDINWRQANPVKCRKLSLPTYPFAKESHWIAAVDNKAVGGHVAANQTRMSHAIHPLLDANTSNGQQLQFRKQFNLQQFVFRDHIVDGLPTLPGVAYMEMALAATTHASKQPVACLKNLVWASPINSAGASDIRINLQQHSDLMAYEICTTDDAGNQQVHAQGKAMPGFRLKSVVPNLDIEAIKQRCTSYQSKQDCYELLSTRKLTYGEPLQAIEGFHYGDQEGLTELRLPVSVTDSFDDYLAHPSMLDGAVQSIISLLAFANTPTQPGVPYVPFVLSELLIHKPMSRQAYAHLTLVEGKKQRDDIKKINIDIVSQSGEVLLQMKEFSFKAIGEDAELSIPSETHQQVLSQPDVVMYQPTWRQHSLEDQDTEPQVEVVLLFDHQQQNRHDLAAAMSPATVVWVEPQKEYRKQSKQHHQLNPLDAAQLQQLFDALLTDGLIPQRVVHHLSTQAYRPTTEAIEQDLNNGLYSVVLLSQCLLKNRKAMGSQKPTLAYLYHSWEQLPHPSCGTVAAFMRSIKHEGANLCCQSLCISHPVNTTDSVSSKAMNWPMIASEIMHGDDIEVMHQGGQRHVRQLVTVDLGASVVGQTQLAKLGGVYLLTGGAGGLGQLFAQELLRTQDVQVILTGRSAQCAGGAQDFDPERVSYRSCDLNDAQQVAELMDLIRNQYGRLDGVIHAAGIIKDGFLWNKELTQFSEVLSPKVMGTVHLDQATKDFDLDYFLLCSSIASSHGNMGQSDYAAGNRFMDDFAQLRNQWVKAGQRSGQTTSINWPLWRNGGMQVNEQAEQWLFEHWGMQAMDTPVGLAALHQVLASRIPVIGLVQGDASNIKQALQINTPNQPTKTVQSLAANVPQQSTQATLSSHHESTPMADKLRMDLTEMVVDLLKIKASDIVFDDNMSTYGFDSVTFTEFANLINQRLTIDVTPLIFFEQETLDELSEYLLMDFAEPLAGYYAAQAVSTVAAHNQPSSVSQDNNASKDEPRIEASSSTSTPQSSPQQPVENTPMADENEQDIAIIGMSGVMPQSADLDSFWQHLLAEKNLVTEIPQDRWDWRRYFGESDMGNSKTEIKWGGFIPEVDKFDADFFNISPLEAELTDPQQRLFLETVWHTIEDAGYQASALKGSNTGVFVGIGTSDYHELLREQNSDFEAYSVMGWMHAVLANRISYFFNWSGPSEPIGTACSSSLVAIDRAVQAIRSGRCDLCVAGGISLILNPGLHIGLGKAAMLSPDGRCKTFDHRANGYVRSEGVGALLLKPLRQAEADGDRIYAVIKGSAVNHGGHVNTFTTPNPKAQTEVLSMAFDDAGIDPATLSYIEAHGTGTALGDPIEIQGLLKAFKNKANQHGPVHQLKEYCALGSVKTNVGHLELAAGMAGMFKLVLALKHQTIPASINFEQVNPYIKLENTPFRLVTRTETWETIKDLNGVDIPRRAGISSFGFGGVNAHLVLQEYRPTKTHPMAATGPQIITLSTKHRAGLHEYAQRLKSHIAVGLQANDLPPISQLAAGLQQGREAMTHRLAWVVDDYPSLQQHLSAYLAGEQTATTFLSDDGAEHAPIEATQLPEFMANGDHRRLALAWVQGHDIDWQQLNPRHEKLSLPVYPFQKNRYWLLDPAHTGAVSTNASAEPPVQPMAQVQSELDKSAGLDQPVQAVPSGETQSGWSSAGIHMHLDQQSTDRFDFSVRINNDCPYLADHHIAGMDLLPAAMYLEWVNQALLTIDGHRAVDFLDVLWLRAMTEADVSPTIQLVMVKNDQSYDFSFTDAAGHIYCRGTVSNPQHGCSNKPADVFPEDGFDQSVDGPQAYRLFKQHGYIYGDSLTTISAIQLGNQTAYSQLNWPPKWGKFNEDRLPAALLDGALQSMLGVLLSDPNEATTRVPVSVSAIEWFKPLGSLCYVQASLMDAEQAVFELRIFNADKQLAMLLSDVRIQALVTDIPIAGPQDEVTGITPWLPETAVYLAQMVAKETKREVSGIDHDSSFDAFGIDSFLAMRMTKKLEQVIGPIQKTVFFEHRSINALAAYLLTTHETALAGLFSQSAATKTADSVSQPAPHSQDELMQATTHYLTQLLATETKRPIQEIPADRTFDALGIDSFLSMRMTKQLEKDLGPIDKTAFFQHNTTAKLAAYLLDHCGSELTQMLEMNNTLEAAHESAGVETGQGDGEALQALLEGFLIQLVATETKTPADQVSCEASFERFGVDSFLAMRMTKKLENAIGPISKTAFFEHRNIADFTAFLLQQHPTAVAAFFAANAPAASSNTADGKIQSDCLVLTEDQWSQDQQLLQTINELNEQYGKENLALARAAIAPLVFLAANRRALFHFNQHAGVALAFTYVGADADLPMLAEEFTRYCEDQGWEPNMLLESELDTEQGQSYTTNTFGVMQRLNEIHALTLQGSKMRRLRYQISKFKLAGECVCSEYHNGTDADTDQTIVEMIDSWAANKNMVNPYIWDVKQQLAQGQLPTAHRIFLTHVNQQLQNVIIITELASENGYLMDLEFYGEHMPLGGLEYAIWHIVQQLKSEGCEVFSMGATFGVVDDKDHPAADPRVTQVLTGLQQQGAFNGQGNLQFKNKFRPVNTTLYLTRPVNADPDKVLDVIMMIANPYEQQPTAMAVKQK